MNPLKRFGGRERQRPHAERDTPEVRANQETDSNGTEYYVLAEADDPLTNAWIAAANPVEARE